MTEKTNVYALENGNVTLQIDLLQVLRNGNTDPETAVSHNVGTILQALNQIITETRSDFPVHMKHALNIIRDLNTVSPDMTISWETDAAGGAYVVRMKRE